eukprot:662418-Hanusia_phi.AAC.2
MLPALTSAPATPTTPHFMRFCTCSRVALSHLRAQVNPEELPCQPVTACSCPEPGCVSCR